MKRIINGKRYDTETAELLHEWDNGRYRNDFQMMEESLYKTPRGAYFVCGRGGPMTKYAVSCGSNSYSGGSDIQLLTAEDAIKWLEEHDGTEALEKHFQNDIEEG